MSCAFLTLICRMSFGLIRDVNKSQRNAKHHYTQWKMFTKHNNLIKFIFLTNKITRVNPRNGFYRCSKETLSCIWAMLKLSVFAVRSILSHRLEFLRCSVIITDFNQVSRKVELNKRMDVFEASEPFACDPLGYPYTSAVSTVIQSLLWPMPLTDTHSSWGSLNP